MCLCSCLLTWILFADRDSLQFVGECVLFLWWTSNPVQGRVVSISQFFMLQLVQKERLHRCWLGFMWLLIGGTWLFASELRASPISPRVFFCLLSSPPPLSASDGSSSLALLITSKNCCQLAKVQWNNHALQTTFPHRQSVAYPAWTVTALIGFQIFRKYLYSGRRSTWFLDWPLVTRYFKLKMNFVFCLCFVGPLLSPQESVALLTQAGLFDNAFTVASHFNLPKETIFEGLASR